MAELEGNSMIEREESLHLQCGRCGWSHVHVCGADDDDPQVLWHRVALEVVREAAVAFRETAARVAPVIGHLGSLNWARQVLQSDDALAAEVEKRLVKLVERRAAARRAADALNAADGPSDADGASEP